MKRLIITIGVILAIGIMGVIGMTLGYEKTKSYFFIEPAESNISTGEEITLTVKMDIDINPGEAVQGWVFNLCYDTEKLELLDSAQLWDCSSKGPNCMPELYEVHGNEGIISYGDILSYSGQGITSNAIYELLRLRFRGRSAGEGGIHFCDKDSVIKTKLVISGEERTPVLKEGEITVI